MRRWRWLTETFNWACFWATLLMVLGLNCLSPTLSQPAPITTEQLPPAATHPLPPSLQTLAPQLATADHYFNQVTPSPAGYLLWTRFPVTVSIEKPVNLTPASAEAERYQRWRLSIEQAITDWQVFFPISLVPFSDSGLADIQLFYREPPLARQVDPNTGLVRFGRARTAQTRYSFYRSTDETPPRLRHRMVIEIKPGLGEASLIATARHELGHALGIWGHSDNPLDSLYPSQTLDTLPLSQRDLKTLLLIYQQPTRLGWPLLP